MTSNDRPVVIPQSLPLPRCESDTIPSQQQIAPRVQAVALPREVGGRDGPEPTRYGDWEKNGRCIDF